MRTVAAQVLRHSLSDVAGQRQSLAARPLSRHGHSPRVPIEGVQRERGHLAGAQAQPGQQQDGAVAPSGGRARVAAGKQRLDLFGLDRLGQSGQTPVHDREYCAGEVGRQVTALVQVAQEAAQSRGDELGAGPAEAPGLAQHELVGVLGAQPLQFDRPRAEAVGQEGKGDRHVIAHRGQRQTAHFDEESLVGAHDAGGRALVGQIGRSDCDPAVLPQVVEQLPTGRGLAVA